MAGCRGTAISNLSQGLPGTSARWANTWAWAPTAAGFMSLTIVGGALFRADRPGWANRIDAVELITVVSRCRAARASATDRLARYGGSVLRPASSGGCRRSTRWRWRG